jgi:hypothetical protein
VAYSATARRSPEHRSGSLDRSACRPVSIDPRPTVASGQGPTGPDPTLSAAPTYPADGGASTELTSARFWHLLPEIERERFGLRFSRLVLKAIRPLTSKEDYA